SLGATAPDRRRVERCAGGRAASGRACGASARLARGRDDPPARGCRHRRRRSGRRDRPAALHERGLRGADRAAERSDVPDRLAMAGARELRRAAGSGSPRRPGRPADPAHELSRLSRAVRVALEPHVRALERRRRRRLGRRAGRGEPGRRARSRRRDAEMILPIRASQQSLLLLAFVACGAAAQDARSWLERMSLAVEQLNYEGTFVHVHGGTGETLQIVHRNDGGSIAERILSLDGAGREIIRREDEVQCILPDSRVVLLQQRKELNPLASALPSYTDDIEANYELRLAGTARV